MIRAKAKPGASGFTLLLLFPICRMDHAIGVEGCILLDLGRGGRAAGFLCFIWDIFPEFIYKLVQLLLCKHVTTSFRSQLPGNKCPWHPVCCSSVEIISGKNSWVLLAGNDFLQKTDLLVSVYFLQQIPSVKWSKIVRPCFI